MTSSLDRIIPAEVKDDSFASALYFLAKNANIKTILEIGASSGEGSTEALTRGIVENANKPSLYSIEVSKTRFGALKDRYAHIPQVQPFNVSSVRLEDFPTESAVAAFYQSRHSSLNRHPLDTILGWLREDMSYVAVNAVPQDGINLIRAQTGISIFDFVLIDGSEFTGEADLGLVYGAPIIALDDINAFKNMQNHERLLADKNYEICIMDKFCRNGFSVFLRR
ncbi:hypothetical protein [Telmatospirillum sp.]|uniref:hypothetical protein n=1 Tax=Telmatospirillum sp. TaxID=2079197 RepID=UPI00283F33D2|nr:hypothetical protein [Telmatospirillum sp.]MDR3436955.1 hypothetical protein [Telmatospirillum sp.]